MKCKRCGGNALMSFTNNDIEIRCLDDKCGDISFLYSKCKPKEENKVPILISNLKKIRNELGLSQSDICKELQVSIQRYGNVERCYNLPTPVAMMPISIALKKNFAEMYELKYITREQYNKLLYCVENEEEKVEYDKLLKKREQELFDLAESLDVDIDDCKIYNNDKVVDTEEIIKNKLIVQNAKREYKKYRNKVNCVLKHKYVIDYYHWIKVRDKL